MPLRLSYEHQYSLTFQNKVMLFEVYPVLAIEKVWMTDQTLEPQLLHLYDLQALP